MTPSNGYLLLLHQFQGVLDGCVAGAPGDVRPVMHLTVLDVNVGDAVVVFLQERNRGSAIPGDEVADIQVDAVVFGIAHGGFPALRPPKSLGAGDVGVAVVANHHLVFFAERAQPPGVTQRDFAGDGMRTGCSGQPEHVVDFLVGEGVDGVHFDDVDFDPGVLVLLAECFDLVHGCRQAPLPQLIGRGLPGRYLLGRQRGAPADAARRRIGHQGGRRSHELLDGLGAQLDRAEVEFDHGVQTLVAAVIRAMEAVGRVDADLHAAKFGIRLRQQAGSRKRSQSHFAEVASSQVHECSFHQGARMRNQNLSDSGAGVNHRMAGRV